MNAVDAIVLALLALADVSLIAHLRRIRKCRERDKRMMRSLQFALQRQNFLSTAPRKRLLRRAG